MDGGVMDDKQRLIEDIVSTEWEFFETVNNIGGQASCQRMPDTFGIMRRAWFSVWPVDALESYQEDLANAGMEGRNPLAEKYGYMMQSTSPDEYAAIKDQLPVISFQKAAMVERVLEIEMEWAEAMSERYPKFRSHGRPLRSNEDGPGITSVETYSRGELSTYSEKTLSLLLTWFSKALAEGRNLQEESDLLQVQLQGWKDLDAVEASLA